MTDEEILKAFECCCGDDVNGTHCKDCPAEKYNFDWCSDEVLRQMVDYTKRLQAENVALRERLDKAVELKVKPGDKVYCIHGMSNPIIIEWQVDEIRITDHNYILQLIIAGTKDYRNELSQYYGKWWFTTREAADARLKELQGGKE